MTERALPTHLVEARRTPVFDHATLPEPLARSHRTTVWATLHVQSGSVHFRDLEGGDRRDERLDAGESIVIAPLVEHQVDPSTDARFFVQFHREPDADLVPGPTPPEPPASKRASAPWEPRGRDLDTPDEVFEMVTRQYADVVQDSLLGPFFEMRPDFVDWDALIGDVTDFWNHVLLYAPDYDIDVIERHRPVHQERPFSAEHFDRWLQIFEDTVDGGWEGPNATRAKKRATGMAWAMAQRFLGHGVWRPASRS